MFLLEIIIFQRSSALQKPAAEPLYDRYQLDCWGIMPAITPAALASGMIRITDGVEQAPAAEQQVFDAAEPLDIHFAGFVHHVQNVLM